MIICDSVSQMIPASLTHCPPSSPLGNKQMKLTPSQRIIAESFASAMMAANNATPYKKQGYDIAQNALDEYLLPIIGRPLHSAINDGHEVWNLGGNASYADDIQSAIDRAQEELYEKQVGEQRDALINTILEESSEMNVAAVLQAFAEVLVCRENHTRDGEESEAIDCVIDCLRRAKRLFTTNDLTADIL